MSKVLIFLVEGATEKEFVKNVIFPHFILKGHVNLRVVTIETSPGFKGGDVRYEARFKPNIKRLLRGTEDLLVTSFIDYYRLKNDFPNYDNSRVLPDPAQRVNTIEEGCAEDIGDRRFIPYIQLYEIEGLLFSATKGFEELFPDLPRQNLKELIEIATSVNPELINDGVNSAPSVRLKRLIPGYQKPLYGAMIALENGLESIILRCPRFKNWIETLLTRMNE